MAESTAFALARISADTLYARMWAASNCCEATALQAKVGKIWPSSPPPMLPPLPAVATPGLPAKLVLELPAAALRDESPLCSERPLHEATAATRHAVESATRAEDTE